MMGDGKALQMGTSHELGQNFARAFDIAFSGREGTRELAWTTSWGSSTRMLGGLIMCHGDDNGLRVPPQAAAVQAVVTVVKDGDQVVSAATKLRDALTDAGVRTSLDDRVDTPFGRRAVDAELKGYPVRIEVGPRDLAGGNVTLVTRVDGAKNPVPLDRAVEVTTNKLRETQETLLAQARTRREEHTSDVSTVDEAIEAAAAGWARLPWSAVGVEGEDQANAQGVTVRCLTRADGSVPDSEDEPDLIAYLARAY
jgi:prolyl-tRNA synthetase